MSVSINIADWDWVWSPSYWICWNSFSCLGKQTSTKFCEFCSIGMHECVCHSSVCNTYGCSYASIDQLQR